MNQHHGNICSPRSTKLGTPHLRSCEHLNCAEISVKYESPELLQKVLLKTITLFRCLPNHRTFFLSQRRLNEGNIIGRNKKVKCSIC